MRILLISSVILLTGCDSAFKQSIVNEWNTAKEYDYKETFRELSGMKKDFPTGLEQESEMTNNLCLHEDSTNRHITANGINDRVTYRGCVLSPSIGVQNPKRMDGR